MDVIAKEYRDRSERFARRAGRTARYGETASIGRAIALCAAGGCFVAASSNEAARTSALIGSVVLLAAWAALQVLCERLLYRWKIDEELRKINAHAAACIGRDWPQMRLRAVEVPESQARLDEDLDLFGPQSLFHLVSRANTPIGITTLRDWLLYPAEPSVIIERQEAVAELSEQLELRQELQLRTRFLAGSCRGFVAWMQRGPWLAERPWLRGFSIALGILPSLSVALTAANLIRPATGVAAVCVASMVNLVFFATFGARMHAIFRKASSRHAGVRQYVRLFDLMARLPAASSLLTRLSQTAADGQDGACRRLRNLQLIMAFGNSHTDTFKTWVFMPLQIFFLWDFHFLALLETWQGRCRKHVRAWFEALGELEALSSLAALTHDNPSWVFPTVEIGDFVGIESLAMGHPLLPDAVRVPNDVTLGPPGTCLFVTGSNMSGKTTLLRALGVNIVLAQAGAPVCAAGLKMSPLELATVVHVDDSLLAGTSMFMAALYRLKPVVESARRLSERSDRTLIYLLDEVMQGTNPLERKIGARKVLGHLLAAGAIGAVSSHDVELADTEPLAEASVAVHFRESIEDHPNGPRMTFDYKMHPGTATSTNALRLLKLVGLD